LFVDYAWPGRRPRNREIAKSIAPLKYRHKCGRRSWSATLLSICRDGLRVAQRWFSGLNRPIRRPWRDSTLSTDIAPILFTLTFSIRGIGSAKLPVFWLLVLIVLPCTAPFSTCDLADLFGLGDDGRAPSHTSSRRAADGSVLDQSHAPAVRIGVARIRLPRLSLLPVSFVVPFAHAQRERQFLQLGHTRAPSALRPVLRI
jgi:hypothetical protein